MNESIAAPREAQELLLQRDNEIAGLVNQIYELRAEVTRLKAERDELNEEIERCCTELGDAGILITQGPRDGITKLVNQRDGINDLLQNECAENTKLKKAHSRGQT